MHMTFNLERDLVNSDVIRTLVQTDPTFAQELYAALCNNQFIHRDMEQPDQDYWSCSWRYAGDVVSGLDANGGDYLDYYCSGNEGRLSSRVADVLALLGWSGRPWPPEQ
jgi:hypothetical protein